jgi:hypothetical protein
MKRVIGRPTAVSIIVSAVVLLTCTSILVHVVAAARRSEALAPAPSGGEDTITILGSGDLLVHPPTWKQAAADAMGTGARYDFRRILAGTAEDVRAADLALCHMEAPLGWGAPQDFPRFNMPFELARAVRDTGYDGCSTASNHALDQGEAGVGKNLRALDEAGRGHPGTYQDRAGAGEGRIYTAKSVKIGHLSYTYGVNGLNSKTWMVDSVDLKVMLDAARRLRRAGAAIIVLSLHGGREHQHQPDVEQRRWVDRLSASPDIDLILGHHTHVLQPFQKIHGKWVAFGLGNAVARHDRPTKDNRTGAMARFTFGRDAKGKWVVVKAEAILTWLSLRPAIRVVSLPRVIRSLPRLDRRRAAYEKTLATGAAHLDGLKAVKDGLVIDGWVGATGSTPSGSSVSPADRQQRT